MGLFDRFRLDGKLALVTGGSRGLGRSVALALAEAGADVVITGRHQDTLDKTADGIRAHGRKAGTLETDMGVPEACEAAFHRLVEEHGPIDILVNNVGNRDNAEPIQDESLALWRAAVDLNLTSCYLGTRIVGASMIRRGAGGRIINISSMNAFISNRGIGGRSYETSKAAVLQLTRAAAADWAPHGITVNAICPGLFMTDVNREWNEKRPEVIRKLVEGIPVGRAGEPDELGPLAVYLASPASGFMTGAGIVIDGGYTLW
jgi:NAD(P)-dependent dehydrogenase (short-subunit alcohol dehydrogenase family)